MKQKRHELLAPAGSLEVCRAVIAAGADAVYLGGDRFGARAYAKNLSEAEILEALELAHLYGRKIFLTVNTLLKNREIGRDLYEYIKPLAQHGLDAIIVQDYGVFCFIKKYFPEVAVHASTQMSVAGSEGAAFLKKRGADRIVTARELSLEEIRRIYEETGVEIESFVHGALCYCYSGHCLMSSIFGGRSGNRGRCAQPCRLAYQVADDQGRVYRKKERYPLSPRDLCTIELLPELCRAGVYSFKIEGRMKQLSYAVGVTEIYRKYLDLYERDPEHYRVEQCDLDTLMRLGNRNGFTEGYYRQRNGRSMMTLTDSSHSSDPTRTVTPGELPKIRLSAAARMRVGEPALLVLSAGELSVETMGEIVLPAKSRPLSANEVGQRLKKTGDTPFVLEEIELELGENAFLPVGQINELRRNALEALQRRLCGSEKHTVLPFSEDESVGREAADREQSTALRADGTQPPIREQQKTVKHGTLTVQISTRDMLKAVLECPSVELVVLDYADGHETEDALRIHRAGKKAGICLPHVLRENSSRQLSACKEQWRVFDRIQPRSFDGLGLLRDVWGVGTERILLDHSLYVFSREAWNSYRDASGYTASLELNKRELVHMPNEAAEFLLYGRIPLMISAQCVYKNYECCHKNDPSSGRNLCLHDRYGREFPIQRRCADCYNIIYNSQPLFLFQHAEELDKLGFGSYRIAFTWESSGKIREILDLYEEAFVRHRSVETPSGRDRFTNGHFKRGVE